MQGDIYSYHEANYFLIGSFISFDLIGYRRLQQGSVLKCLANNSLFFVIALLSPLYISLHRTKEAIERDTDEE